MAPTMQRLRSKSINWMANLPTPVAAATNALTTVKSRNGGGGAAPVETKRPAPDLVLPTDLLTVIFEMYLEMCQHDRRCRITPLLRLCKTTLPLLLGLLYTSPVIHTRIQLYKFVALPSISTHSFVRTLIIEPNGKWDMVDPRDKSWEAIALSQSSRYGRGSGAYEWRAEMGYGKSAREKKEAQGLLAAFKRSIRGDQFGSLRRLELRNCHTMEPAVFQLAKYEELHVDGQCWALVADTIPSSTSTVLLSATNDDEGKPYYYYGQSIIPGAFPYLKTISWKGAIADLPYYAMFRVIQEARIGRREASVWSGTEEGKSLRLDLCYNELWRDPEDILPNAVTPLGMPSSAHGNAPGLEGYFGAARDSSEAVEQLASQIQQAVIGSNNGSGTATPIGAGMIAPAPSTSSTHKLQKLREQQENHMAILERLADSEGVAAVQISFARHPHVFCRERDEDEVGVRRTWRDDMRSERHRRLVLSECERGIECRPSQRSKAQIHAEKLLRHKPVIQDPASPPNRRVDLDVQVPP